VAWYNFCRKHEAVKGQTPGMASGRTDHVYTIKTLIERAADTPIEELSGYPNAYRRSCPGSGPLSLLFQG
jgi:hypothetical protein